MRLIDFARLHWPWRVLFRVLSLSWKLLGSRGPRHHRSSGPALQALASETPDTASKLLPLVTLPILLVARNRCPEPDSNLHRTTYPSPPLRSAQAAQEGGGGPSDYKIVVSCCTTITADGASNLDARAADAAYAFVVLGLNLLLLLEYWLGWLPLRQPQPDLRHVG